MGAVCSASGVLGWLSSQHLHNIITKSCDDIGMTEQSQKP
ncbi:hypothetical protein HMPREF0742_01135 [Rothia aeria F0184]|uniref:Uncharacterized protein n=1 Tax=Rothia aeria F0184 TaxID=888019 RepID=U7V4J5_9MICC|nr:hypothetical protein HMPREF0742_01135 [Rothia aeria F0184]